MNTAPSLRQMNLWILAFIMPFSASFAANVDPEAEAVLRNMENFLNQAESYEVSTTWVTDASANGLKDKSLSNAQVALVRPDKFAFRLTGDSPETVVISDGNQLTTYLEKYRGIAVEPVPPDFTTMPGSLVTQVIGQTPYHGFLFSTALYDGLVGDASRIVYHGVKTQNEVPCHHLEVFRPGPSFELFIQEGDQPLVRAIVPDTDMMEKQLQFRIPGIEIEVSFAFDNWKINQPLDPSVLALTPPEDTFKRATLLQMVQAGPPHALLGKEAPTFSVTKLDGTEFDLSQELGNKVVILDFWSMRCGPCVTALPTLAEVAEEYESKGVVLLAVNLGEPSDMVASFLENRDVDLPVGLDMARTAATSYQVGPIPQTVLIGKSGRVENVHIGLPPNLKSVLSEELDSLLAGKSLLD